MDTNIHCSICEELEGTRPNRLSPILDGAPNAILLDSANFVVIPSVGSLLAGHCLVVTKRHSSNVMCGLNSAHYAELLNILKLLFSRLASLDGTNQLFCFEHGKKEMSVNDVLCSTAHGHLHVLPCAHIQPAQIFEKLAPTQFYDVNEESFLEAIRSFENYIAAFVWRDANDTSSIGTAVDATALPSQYLRRIIGALVGTDEWDWKQFPRYELTRETIDKLSH